MKRKGFTIIELLVVIAAIGILALLGVPAFSRLYQRNKIEETKNAIVSFYQRVNRYAASEGVDYIMKIGGDSLECVKDTLVSWAPKDYFVLEPRFSLNCGGGPLILTVERDGFVRARNNRRSFEVEDKKTGIKLEFYISPIGVMEVRRK
ncbi:MAG: prepilin-type N-terminal cleavage/methylation domain-containing protein [candidate division WOR-3 bacterium]